MDSLSQAASAILGGAKDDYITDVGEESTIAKMEEKVSLLKVQSGLRSDRRVDRSLLCGHTAPVENNPTLRAVRIEQGCEGLALKRVPSTR